MEHGFVARHEFRAACSYGFQFADRATNRVHHRIRIAVFNQPTGSFSRDLEPEERTSGRDYRFARCPSFAKHAACAVAVFLQMVRKKKNVGILEELQVALFIQCSVITETGPAVAE